MGLRGRGRLLPRRGLHRVRRVRVAGRGLRVRGAGNGICEGERVRRWSRAISSAGGVKVLDTPNLIHQKGKKDDREHRPIRRSDAKQKKKSFLAKKKKKKKKKK